LVLRIHTRFSPTRVEDAETPITSVHYCTKTKNRLDRISSNNAFNAALQTTNSLLPQESRDSVPNFTMSQAEGLDRCGTDGQGQAPIPTELPNMVTDVHPFRRRLLPTATLCAATSPSPPLLVVQAGLRSAIPFFRTTQRANGRTKRRAISLTRPLHPKFRQRTDQTPAHVLNSPARSRYPWFRLRTGQMPIC
jgi:hypothetical protein